MDAWEALLAGRRCDFPRGPARGLDLSWRPRTLALLVLMCLVPRAVAAWRWDVLWGDSLHYLQASVALEHGDYDQGFAEFGLNIYPLILIPLRHLGIDWQIAGKWFGVLVASFTVLPLWGWLRRMFDDRLALIACLVYALHGKLIAISPLIIRDSTFWFLLVLTLYYTWRAVGELRMTLFLAAGVALTLAVFTRTEGWLLLVPLLGWGACRWPAAESRLRLSVGVLLCLTVIPAAVTVVNGTWLREHPRWEFFRTAHLHVAVTWWNATTGMDLPVPRDEVPIFLPAAEPPERSMPGWLLTFKLLERMVKACTWIGGLLLLLGLARAWRILLRPEQLTLLGMNLLLLLISRIRYGSVGLDLRYFMPLVIVAAAWMALGLEGLIAAAIEFFRRRGGLSPRAASGLAGSLIAITVTCSFLDGPLAASVSMRKHAALGRWISNRAGPAATIAGNLDGLDTFYSNGRVVGILMPRDCLLVPLPPALAERKADAVVLWNEEHLARERFAAIEQRITSSCGYRRVDAQELPAGENELMVFLREN